MKMTEYLETKYPFVFVTGWNKLDEEGWEWVIEDLCKEIAGPLEEWWTSLAADERDRHGGKPAITSVEEEAGGMQVYMSYIPEPLFGTVTEAIEHAEQRSFEICYVCGDSNATIMFNDDEEIMTLCMDCG